MTTGSAAQAWNEPDKYRTLADSIDEGFCVVEVLFEAMDSVDSVREAVDYRFVEVNPAFERQTGLVAAVGRRMRELAPLHEEFWFETYGRIALDGQSLRFEFRAEALKRWYDVYAFRVGDPEQHLVAILFNDVSERVAARLELEAVARRKDEFVSVLAHELRNPLAPIRNAVTLLKLAQGEPAASNRAVEILERQVEQMALLVSDLTDIGRIGRGTLNIDPRRADLVEIARQSIETALPAISGRGHDLSVDFATEPIWIHADPPRVTQVIANLLLNAAKYTHRGGSIALRVAIDGDQALVVVSDSGIGIPREMLETIFDMFSQIPFALPLSQGGLGIGLSLVKQIVALHGGSVLAESEGEERGSRFSIRLPLEAGGATLV